MDSNLYSDKLVDIFGDSIVFRNYYYPFGNKRVKFEDVDSIAVEKPTLLSGKYRYYGTGDFRTWFPPDNRLISDSYNARVTTIKIPEMKKCQKLVNLSKSQCKRSDLDGYRQTSKEV
ncbi:MAG: hypothetical protein KKF30_18845, partial [Proteobacteria bacterium]|nr:hypothetical protein [Pseudomonadota bacterium]MBU4470860.1 hypothetical protein [Pseudomonadota bacterium]MCG2751858.1 hypothetical protein [Desulfobacteraceae bacterium]